MTIAFIHRGAAILPEISAYRTYFESLGYQTIECHPNEVSSLKPEIEWHFLGRHWRRSNPNALVIHEYASLSGGALASLKNRLKKLLNTRPDFRIFQNDYTRSGLGFTDEVPWGFRSMIYIPGRNTSFPQKEYDFVYAGTLEKSREPEKWLSWFAPGGQLQNKKLLVLGPRREALEKKFAFPWIQFHGPVPPDEVPNYLVRARFGINYQPDCIPFNQQPSSKLLSYAAAGIPIVSSDYQWVREFQEKYGGSFFLIDSRNPRFRFSDIITFPYQQPELTEWTMEYQLNNSGILNFLKASGFDPVIRKHER